MEMDHQQLTERSAAELADIRFLKQVPILNLLNGFEYMMGNVFKSAAEFLFHPKIRQSFLVDDYTLTKNNSTYTDIAIARVRRIIALFSYTLIDVLNWKCKISKRIRDLKLSSFFPSVPPKDCEFYTDLIQLIIKHVKKILRENTILTVAISKKDACVVKNDTGTFYESVLGYRIMSMLSVIIFAEYNAITGIRSSQPHFSNFSVLGADKLSLYVLWNTLFLASGGVTSLIVKTNSSVKSRLLFDFFLKDLHTLFSCSRCEQGLMTKVIDTVSLLKNKGEGERELRRFLAAALHSLTAEFDEIKTTGELVYDILSYSNPGDGPTSGKTRIEKAIKDDANYAAASKGFAALALYLLHSSTQHSTKSSQLDEDVILLLDEPNSPGQELEIKCSSLLAFAAIWALRNSVRASVPGTPLRISEAQISTEDLSVILNSDYISSKIIDSKRLMWRAFEELESRSEVWAWYSTL